MPTLLFIYAAAGPSVDYALPRITKHATVTTVMLTPPSPEVRQVLDVYSCRVLDFTSCVNLTYEQVKQALADIARECRADAILTLAELAVELVGDVARMLGLKGVGPNAVLARDKVRMRQRWKETGVPGPRFHPVKSERDLLEAMKALRPPLIVKHSGSAGSIGHMLIGEHDDAGEVLTAIRSAIGAAAQRGVRAYHQHDAPQFISEELIDACASKWYGHDIFGDYLSVEGLVIDGTYFPICMVGRFPSIPNFIEYGNYAPCMLPAASVDAIEEVARKAVDALGLECCATHTEIKLGKDGTPYLVETAARMGGATITRMVEESFGIDLIGGLVGILLGKPPALPERMLRHDSARRATVNMPVMAATPAGTPWRNDQVFHRGTNWSRLLSRRTTVDVSWGQSLPDGAPIPRFDPSRGVMNYAARLFLACDDLDVLVDDARRLANNMEFLLQDEAIARKNPGVNHDGTAI